MPRRISDPSRIVKISDLPLEILVMKRDRKDTLEGQWEDENGDPVDLTGIAIRETLTFCTCTVDRDALDAIGPDGGVVSSNVVSSVLRETTRLSKRLTTNVIDAAQGKTELEIPPFLWPAVIPYDASTDVPLLIHDVHITKGKEFSQRGAILLFEGAPPADMIE